MRELSPRSFVRLLAPDWAIDGHVLGSWMLFDAYPRGGRDELVLELRGPEGVVHLAVRPDRDAAHDSVGGLAVSWSGAAPHDAANALRLALVALLRTKLRGRFDWVMPSDAALRVPDAIEAEFVVEPTTLDDDPDRELLAQDAALYGRLYDAYPQAVVVRLAASPAACRAVHYPEPSRGVRPPSARLYPAPIRLHRRAFRRYFAALGCVFDTRDGVPRTVPTPDAFVRAAITVVGGPPPLVPALVPTGVASTSAREWVTRVVINGVLPVGVASRLGVEVNRLLARALMRSSVEVNIGMLVHDVSLHALGVHAVPADAWESLVARARRRLPRASRGRAIRLAEFFEGRLTRESWEVWSELADPHDFGRVFATRLGSLCAALDDL